MNQQVQQGTILSDRYTLLREMPSTGGGKNRQAGDGSAVWLARDAHSGDEVSIRILPGNGNWSRFTDTGSRLGALVHPHILRTLDSGEVPGDGQADPLQYIVSTHMEGLHALPLDSTNPAETCRALLPLLEALEFAHSLGIVHGALSRHCLVQDAQGTALLTGFGSELLLAEQQTSQDHISPQVLADQTPQVSDDIYSTGALLFSIFTGRPWMRGETGAMGVSLVPESLQAMIISMLSDSPYDRPQHMAAVTAALKEYLDPDPGKATTPIEATAFRKAETPEPGAGRPTPARLRPPQGRRTIPAGTALSFLAVLLLILLVVFLYQPSQPDRPLQTGRDLQGAAKQAEAPAPQVHEPDGPAPYELAQLERQQEAAKSLAAQLLREQIELEDLGATIWAAGELGSVQAMADQGDKLFRDSQFSAAIENYESGLQLLANTRASIPEVFASNLAKGQDALANGEAAIAIEAFTIATRIEPGNKQATEGLQRAKTLDELRQELTDAGELEQSGALAEALASFQRAATLDPLSDQAKQGVARVSAELRQRKFNQTMSAGFTALQAGSFPQARQSFRTAQQLMPGSPLPADGLNQVDIADRLLQIETLQQQAHQHEQDEQWAAALADYEAALSLDETLVFAQDGIRRTRDRMELQEKLARIVDDPLLLGEDDALDDARRVLYQATLISAPGPVLAGQITAVARHIKGARVPVRVDFISDRQTDIIVYKVKQLGRIERASLELVPGKYTVVGTRRGFRDTRQEFAVQPGQTATITVVCSDQI